MIIWLMYIIIFWCNYLSFIHQFYVWILRFTNVGWFFQQKTLTLHWFLTNARCGGSWGEWRRWGVFRCSWIWDGRMDGFLLERSRFLMAGKKHVVCMVFLLEPKIMFLDFLEKWVEELVKIIKFGPMMLILLGLLAFPCCLKHGSLWVFWYRFYWQTCLAVSQDSNPKLLEMLQFIKEPSWIFAPVLRHTRLIS